MGYLRAVSIVVLLGVIAFFGKHFLDEQAYRTEFNKGIDKINMGNNADAAVYFENLLQKYSKSPEKAQEIKNNLNACYRNLLTNPALNIDQQIAIVKQIQAIDPASLTEADKRLLRLHKK